MTALAEFLLARIAEDEAVARAGIFGASGPHAEEPPHGGACYVYPDAYIRQDPARVLRRCEADRQIVEHHERNPLSEEVGPDCADLCRVCTDAHEPEEWPCFTLRNLASAYADHSDYRAEWKP